MYRLLLAALSVLLISSRDIDAQGREKIGVGRLLTNDVLGDGQDRWRSGSGVVSVVRGYGWDGELPTRMGDLIEYRFRGEVIAPENAVTPAVGDRRYVGALSLGAHTHFQRKGFDFSLGADVVITGPQSGIGDFQNAVHQVLGMARPTVLGAQIPNGFHPTLTFEAARTLEVSSNLEFTPFLELQAGVETLARIGADIRIGRIGHGNLSLRDVVTGQRYNVTRSAGRGFAAILGGDIAYVDHSAYMPESSGFTLTDTRKRLRAGLHWQGESASVFYGVTWLGEEFEAQPESQIVGSLRLDFQF